MVIGVSETSTPVQLPRPAWHRPVGLLLVAPAFVLLIVSYVAPAGWTVWSSFHRVTVFQTGSGGEFTTRGYARVFDRGLGAEFGFALSLAIVPLLTLLIIAPVLAWAAHMGGTVARWVTRGVLVLPLAAYAPTAIAAAWLVDRRPDRADVTVLPGVVRSVYWWGTFGLVTTIAVTVFLAALRRRDPQRSPWPALLVAAGGGAVAVLAVALQEFTTPYVTTFGATTANTPLTRMYFEVFQRGDLSAGAAVSTLLFAALFLLGAGVTVLVVRSGLRLEFDRGYRSADPARRTLGVAIGSVAVLVVLAVTIYGLGPLLGHVFGDSAPTNPPRTSAGQIAANTWLPPLLSTLVGVVAAALAAFGIGALRPLGRHSQWLLLPFGLFLFVGIGPLATSAFTSVREAGGLNSFVGLVPPTWLAIPALFVLTLLFHGQALRAEADQRSLVRPLLLALPMVALAFLVTWVVQARALLWPLLTVQDAKYDTGPVALLRSVTDAEYTGGRPSFDVALSPVTVVLLFLLGLAAQLLYLDRIALRVGPPER
jgi:ABC-type sugar transport system permease subunit